MTERSGRKRNLSEASGAEGFVTLEGGARAPDATQPEPMSSSSSRSGSEKRQKQRELRRKRREVIRTRNMGLGLSISNDPAGTQSKNRIVFNEDQQHEPFGSDEAGKPIQGDKSDSQDNSDDDDRVEEVESNVARAQALDQRATERRIAEIEHLRTKRIKRKARAVEESTAREPERVDQGDEFDEAFFAQVDSEVARARQAKKISLGGLVPAGGKHTTFVMVDEQEELVSPVKADHNIELVVLGRNATGRTGALGRQASAGDTLAIPHTESSTLFGGKLLLNGQYSARVKGNKKKEKNKSLLDIGWKRSKKATILATSRTRGHRRNGRARAAARFVVKP